MRRIPKAITTMSDVRNVTTLADPSIIDKYIGEHKKLDIEIG